LTIVEPFEIVHCVRRYAEEARFNDNKSSITRKWSLNYNTSSIHHCKF
jgi:hypothetical protein